MAIFSTVCTLPLLAMLSFLFNRLRQPVERAIIGDWIKQTKSAWWRFCGRDKTAPKGRKHLPPQKLAEENPTRLRKKGAAAAVVPYLSAFTVGVGATLLIALVVVTFDSETTTEWLMASTLSVFISWALDPLKLAAVTWFVTHGIVHLGCKKRKKIHLKMAVKAVAFAEHGMLQGKCERPPAHPSCPPVHYSVRPSGPSRRGAPGTRTPCTR